MPRRQANPPINLTEGEREKNPVLDEMWRRGIKKRDDILGQDYFARLRDFWNFRQGVGQASRTPTFRPAIQFADLHWMMIQEAGDLTDNSPLPVITDFNGQRLNQHERALRGQWFAGKFNLRFFEAALEALLAGTGWLMLIYDPWARRGRGGVILKPLDPENVVVDDGATGYDNLSCLIYRSRLSLDEIRRCFGAAADRIPLEPSPANSNIPKLGQSQAEAPEYVRMPPGPMQQMTIGPLGSSNELRIVEYFLFKDDGRRQVEEVAGNDSRRNPKLLPPVRSEPMYPNGRMIVRCDSIHLWDGPIPYKRFNFIPVQAHPRRNTFWATPPIRLAIQLQEIAQTLAKQNVENAVRLNNGLVIINEAAGLSSDEVLGLPGERIKVKSPDGVDKAIKILTPSPFPPELWNLYQTLLDKNRKDFGRTDERGGKVSAGNISADLYGASLAQASGLTGIRARLMEPSVHLAMEMTYETMLEFQNATLFPLPKPLGEGGFDWEKWLGAGPDQLDNWELMVDPSSIRAMSSMMARQFAVKLREIGLLDVFSTLDSIGWPDAEHVAQKVEQEQQLQMLAQVSAPGRPRKR